MNKLKKLYQTLSLITDRRFNKKFLYFTLFSIIVSLIELVGISIIAPFISTISNQNVILENSYFSYIYNSFEFSSKLNFIIFFGTLMVFFFILRAIGNLFFIYKINEFGSSISAYLCSKLYFKYLNLKYSVFVEQNLSHMAKTSINESANVSYMIVGLLQLISEIVLAILIYILLFIINWKVTLFISTLLFILAILFYIYFIKKTKTEGYKRGNSLRKMHSILYGSLNNFKIIKLLSNQKQLKQNYQQEAQIFANANTVHHSFSAFPRFILEGISFTLLIITILLLLVYNDGSIQEYIPTIFLFLLALYRLLPAVNKILGGINNFHYLSPILKDIQHDINLSTENYDNAIIEFDHTIKVQDLSFQYNQKVIFNHANLQINKNDKIALIGPSGVGKSTFINILLGFIDKFEGDIYIDNKPLSKDNWLNFRSTIGYIPQEIYLFDSTIAENIVFGRKYDEKKIIDALKKANIYNDLKEKEGIFTKVGDGGVKLSGGQKQRIAIARALYDDPQIIIMDEGTSALDMEVEKKIMDEIFNISQDKTLIVITHRLHSIEDCNKIFELKDGNFQDIKGKL